VREFLAISSQLKLILFTEAYGGPPHYIDFPVDNNHVFGIAAMLLSARSRGTVTVHSMDTNEIPTVDHNYLADPLDLLVLSESCVLGNEIITQGDGTKHMVKGSWPRSSAHHLSKTKVEWVPFVKETAMSKYYQCTIFFTSPLF
jgi:hypothetical protein